jgi:two-component system, LytTR family, response regulator LytT
MKVLVVAEENQVVLKLEKALKDIDNSIRIIGTVPAVFDSAEWWAQNGSPDVILITTPGRAPVELPRTDFRTRFLVRQGQKFASVETGDIAYFFSEGRFIFFKTFDNQKYLVEYTLEELEEMLNPQNFFRINRSLVVSFKGVSQIHPYFGNRLKLFLEPSAEKDVIVSREKVHEFKNWLGQ